MENKELLNKIKVYRAMKNISQEELAVAIGVTRKTINTQLPDNPDLTSYFL